MKKNYTIWSMLLVILAMGFTSCSDEDTYADQKERERDAIKAFINRENNIVTAKGEVIHIDKINAISEQTFAEQGDSTSVDKNEYVLFSSTGIYMQIVRKGIGEPIAPGESKQVVCRFQEYNILGDSLQVDNETTVWSPAPDVMNVSNTDGTIVGTFTTMGYTTSAMIQYYGTTVPSGWLVPLKYVGLGTQQEKGKGIALVRLIVPHSQGHTEATQGVYPCFYQIKFQQVASSQAK